MQVLIAGCAIVGLFLCGCFILLLGGQLMWVGRSFGLQNSDELPFIVADQTELPRALTPDGSPLSLEALEGEYVRDSDFQPVGLVISADGHWKSWFSGPDFDLPAHRSRGSVRVEDGRLRFESVDFRGRPTGKTLRVIPIWWEDFVVLVEPARVDTFTNYLNEDGPQFLSQIPGRFLVRKSPRTGPLVLPREMAAKVLSAPVWGALVSKTGDDLWAINVGSKDGVYAGLVLHTSAASGTTRYLKVVSVETDRCLARPGRQKFELHEGMAVGNDARGAGLLR